MTAGPCVSLPKIESVSEKPSSAAHLGGQRRSLTGGVSHHSLTNCLERDPATADLLEDFVAVAVHTKGFGSSLWASR